MSANDILKRVQKGELKPHELEEHVDPDLAANIRRQILESELNVKLSSIGNYTFDAKLASTTIENMIGNILERKNMKAKYVLNLNHILNTKILDILKELV